MNLRSLRLFRRIVITGSLAEASNDLNVSVSAASRLLALLEAELKLPLFSRAKRRLELTEEGDLFYRQVEHILRGLDELGQVSNDIRKRTRERLSLVTAAPIAMGLISPTLAAMRRQAQDFECLINVETRFDIESKVAARAYNLGIISLPIENAIVDLAIEPFLESRLEVAMPVGHPLAERREIDVETLASQPLVALTVGQRWRERLDEVFATGSLQPRIEIETTSTPVVMQLVREGIGLTVVDQVCGQVAGNGIVMRPLSPERWITYASIHPQGPRQPLADRFVDAMCDWIESRRNADTAVAENLRLITEPGAAPAQVRGYVAGQIDGLGGDADAFTEIVLRPQGFDDLLARHDGYNLGNCRKRFGGSDALLVGAGHGVVDEIMGASAAKPGGQHHHQPLRGDNLGAQFEVVAHAVRVDADELQRSLELARQGPRPWACVFEDAAHQVVARRVPLMRRQSGFERGSGTGAQPRGGGNQRHDMLGVDLMRHGRTADDAVAERLGDLVDLLRHQPIELCRDPFDRHGKERQARHIFAQRVERRAVGRHHRREGKSRREFGVELAPAAIEGVHGPDCTAEIEGEDPRLDLAKALVLAREFLDPAGGLEAEGDRQGMAVVGASGGDCVRVLTCPFAEAIDRASDVAKHRAVGAPDQQQSSGRHDVLRRAAPVDEGAGLTADVRQRAHQ